jgi:hypothetical protein
MTISCNIDGTGSHSERSTNHGKMRCKNGLGKCRAELPC